jgi:dephospho-CoA kinase
MKLPQIVGISGTNGAGKDELGLLLAERCGYHFHSVSELLRAELTRQGKEITRENTSALSKQWRNESGDDGVMFTKAIEQYLQEKDEKGYKGVALVNMRHPGEVATIHSYGGVAVWIDANQQVRYDRIQSANRGRAEDLVTFEQFQADEYREMHPPADAPAGTLNMAAVKEIADIHIENDFPSVEAYRAYLINEFEL